MSNPANRSDLNPAQPDDEAVAANQIWTKTVAFLWQLRIHYPLYFVFLFIFLVLAVAMYVLVQPVYTASAIIGPPSQSSATSMLSSGLDGGAGSTFKRLLGGATGSTGNDSFQEYQQVLHSSRLAAQLAEEDGLLPKLFSEQWDAEHKRWRAEGDPNGFSANLKRALHRPVVLHPDANTLEDVLGHMFSVSAAPSSSASLLSMGTSYMIVTLKYRDPQEAENLLNIVLSRADAIIRQDQQRDVVARISYIESELPTITQAEQREALIQILSSQEEQKTMMVADKRFSFTMIDPPHASPIPTFPMRPSSTFLLSAFAALVSMALVVYLGTISSWVRKLILPFRRDRKRSARQPAGRGQRVPNALQS
jgi:hypothetical protein